MMLRLYTGGDGQSHLAELNPPMGPEEAPRSSTPWARRWSVWDKTSG